MKTIEQKANDYDKALDIAKSYYEEAIKLEKTASVEFLESMFDELRNNDERIRKEIIEYIKTGTYHKDWIAWLEKQRSEPNWCHHKVDLSNCSEEYRKAYYDGWNNCNMQHSQCAWTEADDEELEITINALKGTGQQDSIDWLKTTKWLLTIKQRMRE